jgi:hypothetical protein
VTTGSPATNVIASSAVRVRVRERLTELIPQASVADHRVATLFLAARAAFDLDAAARAHGLHILLTRCHGVSPCA